jgi:hypothetical protein
MEIWKPVIGHAHYEVSTLGRVRNAAGRVLRPGAQSSGHLSVVLGRGNTRTVHSLALEAFAHPRRKGLECRHLDGNPANNKLENLAWGTRAENNRDKFAHGGCYKLTPTTLAEIRAEAAAGKTGYRIAKERGLSMSHVYRSIK